MEMAVSDGDKVGLRKRVGRIPSKVLRAVHKSKLHLAAAGIISLVVLSCLATSFSPLVTYNPLSLWNSGQYSILFDFLKKKPHVSEMSPGFIFETFSNRAFVYNY